MMSTSAGANVALLTARSAVSAGTGTPGPLITAPRAHRAAGEHDPPPPASEQVTIDYFESMLGADLGIAAYVSADQVSLPPRV